MRSGLVILVDRQDNEMGFLGKQEAHSRGLLHRAFSVFVFNSKGEFLLQRRAFDKYHSPGLWSNTCCSHPMPGEPVQYAASRRLLEEMGMQCLLENKFSFVYKADVGDGLIEHEFDHVFVGVSDEIPNPDPEEVDSWRYVDRQTLKHELEEHPETFTEWFKICLSEYEKEIFSRQKTALWE